MAKVRIGFSTHFEVENELVGIGTDNPTNTKQVLGNIKSSDAKVIGITTLTTFDGFTDTKLSLQGSAGSKQHTTSDEIIIEGDVTVSSGTTFTSGPENLTVTDSFTLPGISDDKPSVGTTRFNENLGALEFYTGVEWRAVNSYVDMGNRGRGVFGGGQPAVSSGVQTTKIDYIDISSQGNASTFGDLTVSRRSMGCFSSATRGVWGGGRAQTPGWTEYDTMDYVTLASEGNAIDFGNRIAAEYSMGGFSSSTRGIIYGGAPASDDIHYTEIATLGNEVDFGSLITGRRYSAGCASATRGLMGGGHPDAKSSIEFITIASKGNANSFGDLTVGRYGPSACASATRGIFAAGHGSPVHRKVIDYVTIASEGNAINFGELIGTGGTGNVYGAMTASQIRGVYAGGYSGTPPSGSSVNRIQYINIQSSGNAEDFGDLTHIVYLWEGCSDSHGGLGGF